MESVTLYWDIVLFISRSIDGVFRCTSSVIAPATCTACLRLFSVLLPFPMLTVPEEIEISLGCQIFVLQSSYPLLIPSNPICLPNITRALQGHLSRHRHMWSVYEVSSEKCVTATVIRFGSAISRTVRCLSLNPDTPSLLPCNLICRCNITWAASHEIVGNALPAKISVIYLKASCSPLTSWPVIIDCEKVTIILGFVIALNWRNGKAPSNLLLNHFQWLSGSIPFRLDIDCSVSYLRV